MVLYLHCFEYGRGTPKELEKYCKKVFYYQRNSAIKNVLSSTPFRIKSRSNQKLVENLKKIDAPILFEGLHTTYALLAKDFATRQILVRAHNIEHFYHDGLYDSETRIDRKLFFKSEAIKLRFYEKILEKVDVILTISPAENIYFNKKFKGKAIYIPAFHENIHLEKPSKKGDYALYHGDLRVSDNKRAVRFLLSIFKEIDYTLIIASSFKDQKIVSEIEYYGNIKFVQLKTHETLEKLLKNAHINVLPTFQNTGIKLKLINTLFKSRFCVVTNEMVEGTGLEDICIVCKTKREFIEQIHSLRSIEYNARENAKRTTLLKVFDTKENAQQIIDLLD